MILRRLRATSTTLFPASGRPRAHDLRSDACRPRLLGPAWRACVLACLLTLAQAPLARGEEPAPNPVTVHFRASQEAIRRGDLVTAETEAAAALTESVNRYGDGGRTAVLAVNLAQLRLALRQYERAVEPARLALRLSEANQVAAGIDPRFARLLLAQAELPDGGVPGAERLEQAIAAAKHEPQMQADALAASIELGKRALAEDRHRQARVAWATAVDLLEPQSSPNSLPLAQARLGLAAAGILELARTESPGTALNRRLGPTSAYREPAELLVQVIDGVAEQALGARDPEAAPRAQSLFAQAVAWRGVVNAKLRSEHRELRRPPEPKEWASEIGAARHALPPCDAGVIATPEPRYPPAKFVSGGVGSVVMRMKFSESGHVEESRVEAAVGGASFSESVSDVASQWRLVKRDPAETDCRLARERFLSVTYVFD